MRRHHSKSAAALPACQPSAIGVVLPLLQPLKHRRSCVAAASIKSKASRWKTVSRVDRLRYVTLRHPPPISGYFWKQCD